MKKKTNNNKYNDITCDFFTLVDCFNESSFQNISYYIHIMFIRHKYTIIFYCI